MRFLCFYFALTTAGFAADFSSNVPKQALRIEFRKGEKIRFEYMRPGAKREALHNTQSLSKSVLALLVGIARDQGTIQDLDEGLAPLLWKGNPKKFRVSWRELLTMHSGFPSTSREAYGKWVAEKNWVDYFLRQKQSEPREFSYSTGDSHLLAVALERRLPGSLDDFAREHFFAPLGIARAVWARDPQGNIFGGNNLQLTFTDVVKIGQMVLNGGRAGDRKVVSRAWIQEMLGKQTVTPPDFVEFQTRGYGYYWWLIRIKDEDGACALGYGGQFLCIFPRIQAQFTIFSRAPENPASLRVHYREIQDLLHSLLSTDAK